jgi:hypothetical protein
MECPSCHSEIPDDSRYCETCGAGLPVRCAACGATSRAGAKFCSKCGKTLTAETPAAPANPTTVAPTRQAASAERRQLTIMLCDLVGSTALSARLDPEDMREIIGAYHRCCVERARADREGPETTSGARLQSSCLASAIDDRRVPWEITTCPGPASACSRAARFGVSPTTPCFCAAPSPIRSPTTTNPVAMPTRTRSALDPLAMPLVGDQGAKRSAIDLSSSSHVTTLSRAPTRSPITRLAKRCIDPNQCRSHGWRLIFPSVMEASVSRAFKFTRRETVGRMVATGSSVGW